MITGPIYTTFYLTSQSNLSIVFIPIASVLSFNPIGQSCGTVLNSCVHNISNDSSYFRWPDEERFYPFEILALRTLKL